MPFYTRLSELNNIYKEKNSLIFMGNNVLSSKEEKSIDKEYGKVVRNILLVLAGIIIILGVWMFFSSSSASFEHRGVKVNRVQEIAPYMVSIPLAGNPITGAATSKNFNVFLRTDPRELDKVEIEGELIIKENIIMKSYENFSCEGLASIGVMNLVRTYEFFGAKVGKDSNATCSENAAYTLISFEEGDKTEIIQTGPSCYSVKMVNCEVIPATERMVFEFLVQAKEAGKI